MLKDYVFLKTTKQHHVVQTILLLTLLSQPLHKPLSAAEASPEWLYSIRPGDTLIHFGQRHLINPDDWHTLQKINHIKNPYRMPVGSKMRVPLNLLKQGPTQAEVVLALGDVYMLKGDKSRRIVVIGQQLEVGAELQTGAKSKLNIRFADGSIVTMQPNTVLKLDTLSMYSGGAMVDTKLRLQQGGVEIEANPKHVPGNSMQIFTPTAVAAVRGTEFRVFTESRTIWQETLNGQVALSAAGNEVSVAKGYGTLSENGQPPLPPVELLPAPNTEQLPVKFESEPILFNMPSQQNAQTWIGKLYKEAQLNTLLAESVSQSMRLDFGDIADGQYYLKVRAKDKQGLEGYDAVHVFMLNARPFAPQAIYPQPAQIIRESKPVLSWASINQASAYLIELARDADFKQVLEMKQVASNQFEPEKTLQPGQYFWRLASLDGTDQGPYSATNQFSYKSKPPAPDIRQLNSTIARNRVFIDTIDPPDGLVYQATLDNDRNNQKNVWQAADLNGRFNFLLREYGKQTLRLRLIDAEGIAGPEAVTEFNASP